MLPYPLSTNPHYRRHAIRARELRSRYIASLARAAAQRILKIVAGFRRWRQRRQAIAEMNRLDDRILKDMGLSRSQIHSVVHGLDDPRPLSPTSRRTGAAGMSAQDCIDAAVATGRMDAKRGLKAKRLLDAIEAGRIEALGPQGADPASTAPAGLDVPFARAAAGPNDPPATRRT